MVCKKFYFRTSRKAAEPAYDWKPVSWPLLDQTGNVWQYLAMSNICNVWQYLAMSNICNIWQARKPDMMSKISNHIVRWCQMQLYIWQIILILFQQAAPGDTPDIPRHGKLTQKILETKWALEEEGIHRVEIMLRLQRSWWWYYTTEKRNVLPFFKSSFSRRMRKFMARHRWRKAIRAVRFSLLSDCFWKPKYCQIVDQFRKYFTT